MGTERYIYERDRHDGDAVACLLAPVVHAAGTFTTPTIYMRGFDRVLFSVLGGAVDLDTATLDIVVRQCTQANNAGADAKVLAGIYGTKAIAQVTSGTDYASLNQKWLLEIKTEEMDVDNGFDYLLLSITISAGRTWALAVEAIRSVASYEPVAHTNITEVVA